MLFDLDLKLNDIAKKDRILSPDKKKVAAFFVSHHHEDMYDECTRYAINVWDKKTQNVLASFSLSWQDNRYTETQEGKQVVSVKFSKDGKCIIIQYDDKTEETKEIP